MFSKRQKQNVRKATICQIKCLIFFMSVCAIKWLLLRSNLINDPPFKMPPHPLIESCANWQYTTIAFIQSSQEQCCHKKKLLTLFHNYVIFVTGSVLSKISWIIVTAAALRVTECCSKTEINEISRVKRGNYREAHEHNPPQCIRIGVQEDNFVFDHFL